MNKNKLVIAAVIVASAGLTGCASIVNGSSQVLSVETHHKGEAVVGASCQLVNPKGTFYVKTPGTVTVHRAYDDMNIKCEKDGLFPGLAAVKSSTKAMAFGNIVFGGVIGAAVDVGTGAAYDYPSVVRINMGENPLPAAPVVAQTNASVSTDAAQK